ncbi:MAG: hypothetical protein EXS51_03325, partial [Candidatus Taylorbacteria bacterium]|nr:hypothetical protein [Candidatus Taylorbacteria bacterium]
MASPLLFDGKKFISSSEASKATGFASDYIGQLCRGGKLVCRRVGKSWFVEEDSILLYKALDLNHSPAKAKRLNGHTAPAISPEQVSVSATSSPAPEPAQISEATVVKTEVLTTPVVVDETITETAKATEVAREAFRVLEEMFNVREVLSPHLNIVAPALEVSPEHTAFKKIAQKVSRRVNEGRGSTPRANFLSSVFVQKASALVISIALVFGPYFAKDSGVLQEASRMVASYGGEMQGGLHELAILAGTERADFVAAFLSSAQSLASASESFGSELFSSGVKAVHDVRDDVEKSALVSALALGDMRDGVLTLISTSGTLASAFSGSVSEGVAMFAERITTLASLSEKGSGDAFTALVRTYEKAESSLLATIRATTDKLATLQASVGEAVARTSLLEKVLAPFERFARFTYRTFSPNANLAVDRPGTDCVPPEPCAKGDVAVAPTAPVPADVATSTREGAPRTFATVPVSPTPPTPMYLSSGLSSSDVDARLASLQAKLSQDIASVSRATTEVRNVTEHNS